MSTVLGHFIEHAGRPFHPNRWAAEHGVGESVVVEQLQRLEREGFSFEWEGDVCRLVSYPKGLSLLYLAELSEELSIPLKMYGEIDSTNTVADQLRSEQATPFLVGAIRQTKGRGRLGRTWYSGSAQNFYFSLVFSSPKNIAEMSLFTLWMGVALANFLRQCTGAEVQVKWPNDLYLKGKKIGGMLTEARPEQGKPTDYIFGVGLNVGASKESLPEELAAVATTLQAEGITIKNINEFALQWMDVLSRSCEAYLNAFDKQLFNQWWTRYDFLVGKAVMVIQGSRQYRAICLGIDESGALLVQDEAGERQALHGGEVSLSLNGNY